ncbi:probable salivary secreted peptide [Fopius arisanus]|uniref:Probable salivary secreted peptide n=1 Tax=Fopius arisanus TaxID=64838 RepID=A0A9R1UBA7_9HYME|nr:PREDICTED: probable salivary secreted peptide [Fopius arisanus]
MFPKLILPLLLAAIVLVLYTPSEAYVPRAPAKYPGANRSHHLIAGNRLPGDRLAHQEYIYRGSSVWQMSIQRIFSAAKFEKITQVLALDQTNNGTGGYANIVRGGPGSTNVTLQFTNQKNYGLRFLVQIYARR